MTKSEAAEKAGYKEYDTSLPQGWWNSMHAHLKDIDIGAECTNPSAHFVWVYENKNGSCGPWGIPGPLTPVGKRALRMLDEMDEREHIPSPSLSGVCE